ncbi:MAG: phosphoenolpyruvate--protein phosphotransferase [Lachnospiraceae bacterium]|nr:phosphoenolpyruvate--protein phosphotransferase [Lachnospiraceae bacterium]
MEQYTGKSILEKIAIGKVYIYKKKESSVRREHVDDVDAEIRRFETAKTVAIDQLNRICRKALKEVGKDNTAIFEAHRMILEDREFADSVCRIIREQNVNAEYAATMTGDHFSAIFAGMDDEYMKARAADVKDISERLVSVLRGRETDTVLCGRETNVVLRSRETDKDSPVSVLCGRETGTGSTVSVLRGRKADTDSTGEPVILMADDLTPSETVQLDKSKILAFVTRHGSPNSHTAILARAMNIPAVIGIDIRDGWNGKTAIVDGYTGQVTIDPDPAYLEAMTDKMQSDANKQKLLKELKGKETVTKSGRRIRLYANIGGVKDIAAVLQNDGEGIGLFRSEFLYLESDDFPSEEKQFQVYKTVAESMPGKKVIIRTLDIGADKQADYFGLEKEDNPAMGYRAIRICLDRPEILRTQLRAILRAGACGNISVMFPMIISVQEVLECKRILAEVKAELKSEGIAYRDAEVGIMIETPAAVWISGELAREVDFFSIGTNDLTQYTLAIDRLNTKLDHIYDPHHPAILRAIQTVIENGHKGGARVGICGELGADTTLTETFVRMGIDELSVSPSFILPVRDAVRKLE